MPTNTEFHPIAADAFSVSIYVPVHYEYSQVEYVAPFLEQYQGSKVFIYKWNGRRDKMIEYYSRSPEYTNAQLGVYDFSLQNIVSCILDEPPEKKVVFLLTASMAYCFGEYQRNLLKSVKTTLEEVGEELIEEGEERGDVTTVTRGKAIKEKVWGVSVIGHCMYGCMSCKGNDHKVPVYYTRYFKGNIPYTKEHVRAQFKLDSLVSQNGRPTGPIPVLCAPSTGETTVLQQRGMLEYLKELQVAGRFKFVWKFHPAVYNMENYDLSVECDRIEVDNVKWIMDNFEVTREDEPCLLPFIEAFDLIFCDLHSSVPFIASYFSPKAILCFWNDADYEVPAGRDPVFLSTLHVFQHLNELQSILPVDPAAPLPQARGDIQFFWSQYGKVDGNEIGRFATLAQWPTKSADTVVYPRGSLRPAFRRVLASAARAWDALLAHVEVREDAPKDEDSLGDMLQAMGLFKDTLLLPRVPRMVVGAGDGGAAAVARAREPSVPADAGVEANAAGSASLTVMTLNMWWGTEGCFSAQLLAGTRPDVVKDKEASGVNIPSVESRDVLAKLTAKAILDADADVVGCQEVATLARDNLDHEREIDQGELGGREWAIHRVAAALRDISGDSRWTAVEQGNLTPGKACRHPWAILTRLPVVRVSAAKFGIQVAVPGVGPNREVWVWNAHFGYKPYGPYQVERPTDIPYEGAPPAKSAQDAVQMAMEARGPHVDALIADMRHVAADTTVHFVTGDFNEPSHLDWTNLAAIAGYHPMPVLWPATRKLADVGFVDSLRAVHPDPVAYPAFTWAAISETMQAGDGRPEGWRVKGDGRRDVADRIDFVLHKGVGVHAVEAHVVGPQASVSGARDLVDEGVVSPGYGKSQDEWTTDHRAVVVKFVVGATGGNGFVA